MHVVKGPVIHTAEKALPGLCKYVLSKLGDLTGIWGEFS